MTDDSIDKLITLNVPEETRKSTRWDTKVWRNWAAFSIFLKQVKTFTLVLHTKFFMNVISEVLIDYCHSCFRICSMLLFSGVLAPLRHLWLGVLAPVRHLTTST